MPKGIYPHKLRAEISKYRTSQTLKKKWATARKGKTYEEIFGKKLAKQMRLKMSLAKLGKEMPWNALNKPRGKDHPRWIKDRTKIKRQKERGGTLHHQWSRNVKERDDYRCRLSSKECSGKIISHHIRSWKDYPNLRYDINNGITLCHFHHPRRREDEKRLIQQFTIILRF